MQKKPQTCIRGKRRHFQFGLPKGIQMTGVQNFDHGARDSARNSLEGKIAL